MCSCGNDKESTARFFLHCPNFTTQRQTLFNKLKNINASIMNENENSVVRMLLFRRPEFIYPANKEIINASICFILTTERLNCPLLLVSPGFCCMFVSINLFPVTHLCTFYIIVKP